MIKALAHRTRKSGLKDQAAALGIPKSTLHRWIGGDLPNQDAYEAMLTKAQLTRRR